MPSVTSSDGPVAVTGASGFIGAHTIISLLKRGYDVRACVTDLTNPDKTEFLLALNNEHPGNVTLVQANMLEDGSYDDAFAGCSAVLHVGTPMGYGGANNPVQVYEGAINGIKNIIGSVKRAGTVRRFIYTSSFAAIGHPAPPGYVYNESDWASDNRDNDANWNTDNLIDKGEVGYAMAKVECERLVNRLAEEDGGFDAISVCPIVVLGPLLSPVHECVGSWQWHLGRTLAGKTNQRGWQALWNIVDVRDVGESQVLMIESDVCTNGSRYQLSATDESGEITARQLQEHLLALFPNIDVGAPPPEYDAMIEKHGKPYDAPRAHCDKAREELGLQTHAIEDTLKTTGETMIALGLVEPKLK
jgi:nucleoside-diphosphate-sugar epimerase